MVRLLTGLLLVILTTCCFAQQSGIDSLLQVANRTPLDKQSEIYLSIAQIVAGQNTLRAIEFAQSALDKSVSDEQQLAAVILLGNLHFRSGNMPKAIDSYKRWLMLAEKSGNEKRVAQAETALGSTYFISGNLSDALSNYLQALRYYEKSNDIQSLIGVYSGLVEIYDKQNNFSKSLEYNLKALAIHEASSDKFSTVTAYDHAGKLYLRQKNYSKSKEYFSKSLQLYNELNNSAGQASTLIQLGILSAESNKHEQAVNYFESGFRKAKELKILPMQASALNGIALSYEKIYLYDKAIQSAKAAESIAKSASLKIELEQAYETLARLYQLTKEPDKAKTFSSLSELIKDSLYNDRILKQLADYQLRYENEKSEKQFIEQQRQQALLMAELQQERFKTNSLIFVAIVVAILALVMFVTAQRITRLNRKLSTQKNELEQINNAIEKQKDELGRLNQVKDRFFSIISHDLRNNLTTMKLYFNLTSNPDYTPDESYKELSTQIASSVDNTIDLLENLLVWAQMQIKGVDYNPQLFSVKNLIEDNVNLLAANASYKNIQTTVSCNNNIEAYADIDMMNLVLRNLISNAIKFTEFDGSIHIHGRVDEDRTVIISITDSGVGISEENMQKLFSKSVNPSTLGTGNEKGTGLGLLLCKEFVEKNNGVIHVQSKVGQGTTFTIHLPLLSHTTN